jgi:tetratricopeptide (TPR) repeat protein
MSFDDLVEKALFLHDSGQAAAAAAVWEQSLQLLNTESPEPNPDKAEVQLKLAHCWSQLGRHEEALELCESVAEYYGSEFSDVSDEAQRALTALVDVATAASEHNFAHEMSEAALEALESEENTCESSTLVAFARTRALLAIKMGQPDDAEDAWDLALEKLTKLLELEEMEEEFYYDVLFHQARCHEFRSENRFRGGAVEIAEIDLKDAYELYKKVGSVPDDVERVRLRLLEVLQA